MSGWVQVKLGEISTNIQTGPFGSQLHQSDYEADGVPVIMPKDIVNGAISETSIARIGEQMAKKLSRHKVVLDDIVYPRRGDVAKCAIIGEKQSGWLCGTGCLKVTIDKAKALPLFVYYQLQTPSKTGWIEKHTVGATMPNLNTGIIGQVPIDLPSLNSQCKITDILSAYDDLIDNYRRQIKLLEEAAGRLYKEWFVDLRFPGYEQTKIVDGVPDGWRWGKLGDIAVDSGRNEKKQNRTNYAYYLPIDCLPKKSLTYLETNEIECAESSLVAFNSDDIVFGAMRPYFHKVVIARDKGLTRTTCFVINSRDKKYWSFLAMLLFSEDTINYATKISVGTTMPYVRWKDFIQMPIIVPDEKICIEYGNYVSPILLNLSKMANQITILTESRDRLLPKLMSGEIKV